MLDFDKESRTLWMYGEVTSTDKKYAGEGFSDVEVVKALRELGTGSLKIHISSPGGSVDMGLSIYNQLKRHSGTITTINDSVCASIASVIFCAGQERLVSKQSHLLLHSPHCMTAGNSRELRTTADLLDKYERTMAEIYLGTMAMDEAELLAILTAETWLNSDEAIAYGIATGIHGQRSKKTVKKLAASKVVPPTLEEIAAGKRRLQLSPVNRKPGKSGVEIIEEYKRKRKEKSDATIERVLDYKRKRLAEQDRRIAAIKKKIGAWKKEEEETTSYC